MTGILSGKQGIKKLWIIIACIILFALAFALIYPTVLFVYIKIFAIVSWVPLLTLWPCLVLLIKRKKLSLKNILGIFLACLLIPPLLWLLHVLFSFPSPTYYFSTFIPDLMVLLLVLSLFYFLAFLPMFLLRKRNIGWWLILLIMNVAIVLFCTIRHTVIYYHSQHLTTIRTKSECIRLDNEQAKIENEKIKNATCGDSWIRYSWKAGMCEKKSTHYCESQTSHYKPWEP